MALNPTGTMTPTTYSVTVDGVGTFTFAKRSMRSNLAVAAEYSRLTEGVENPVPFLDTVATWMSTLKVLTVNAPDGWVLDDMDPEDTDTYARLGKVYSALRGKEDSFRRGANPVGPPTGA